MKPSEIRNWLITSMKPLMWSIPVDVMDQQIESAIRYWNTNSAYKVARMYDHSGNAVKVDLSTDIKNVVKVYPSVLQETLFSNHPMWALLGFITLDRFTTDLLMLSNAFEGYRIYLGTDFKWKYIRSEDQNNTAGRLLVENVPSGASKLAVIGLKWITPDEDVTDDFILDWLLNYSLALCKIKEGNVLRKGAIIGITGDGSDFLSEGKEEKKSLEDQLRLNSRWALLMKRK